ncbi:[protein-PII] uridylyltransferase [Terrarubrum flagellatum]|uniref:[protein-PII] uridylyltransferase n=1 Tax=Terrirubrum flagellatum TaxID=2895980 RepID=UPI003144D5ED
MSAAAPLVASQSQHARSAAELRARIDDIVAASDTVQGARPQVLELLRDALARGREEARAQLRLKRDGFICARALAANMDDLIHATHHFVTAHLYRTHNPSSGERIGVAAVGGYGRGTLAPGSDVDLLFLMPSKRTAWVESVVEAMLYLLWDLRLKVGHSTRTIEDCLREARGDMTIRTALLEARHLVGDRPLFADMEKRFRKEIVEGTASEFVQAKLAERENRVDRAGHSRYLVEPNVKDGKGGLRDLNTLFWIAKYVYRVQDPKQLVKAGLFSRDELSLFERCEEFLWRVRCHMHFATGRAEERLSFDMQRLIAPEFGYAAHGGLSAVERFMKRYFLIAKDVGDLTAIVCAALEAREAKPRAMLDRIMGRLRRRQPTRIDNPDFAVETNRLTIARQDVFERDPVNLIRLFHLADKHNIAIHPHAIRRVTQSLHRIDRALRANPEANQLFLDILTSRRSPEVVLRRMNESGVLGKFIPDFGRVVAMMQFNMYHHYTVDEHLIRTIGVLAEVDAGRLEAEHPLANKIMPTLANRRALYVALFLHDIAKGRPEDHSIAGAKVARKLCPRLGLSAAETDTVVWLVTYHLTMSTIAQSRDLSDPKTIESFANIVQSLERLKLLLVLTVCDIKAVGPGVWNGWKGQLLRTLYYETEVVLTGGHSGVERKERVRLAQAALRERLPAMSDDAFAAYAARHYPAYWLKVDLEQKVKQHALLASVDEGPRKLASAIATDAFRGVTELTVLAPDHPRLLSIVTGACAAAGANIVDAQIYTTTDGWALDTISISRAFDRDDDELRRAERVTRTIEQALQGEVHAGRLVRERHKPRSHAKTFDVAPEVIIDNALSGRFTVIEVSGLDRQGLLYDLTSAISKLNLNIGSAHIATFGERAVDSFYVTDLTGGKIENANRQNAIRKHLLEVFHEEPHLARSA